MYKRQPVIIRLNEVVETSIISDKLFCVIPFCAQMSLILRFTIIKMCIRDRSLHSAALRLDRQMRSGDNGEQILVNVNNNVGRLEQKFEDITGETKKIVRYLKNRTNLSDWKRSERNI